MYVAISLLTTPHIYMKKNLINNNDCHVQGGLAWFETSDVFLDSVSGYFSSLRSSRWCCLGTCLQTFNMILLLLFCQSSSLIISTCFCNMYNEMLEDSRTLAAVMTTQGALAKTGYLLLTPPACIAISMFVHMCNCIWIRIQSHFTITSEKAPFYSCVSMSSAHTMMPCFMWAAGQVLCISWLLEYISYTCLYRCRICMLVYSLCIVRVVCNRDSL
jgi:hypothetical protein